MILPDGVMFLCGNCSWWDEVKTPPEKKKDYPVGRGFCIFEPPKVFPMPQQQGKLADIQGQAKMGVVPYMMRPVLEETERACGRYAPDPEMLAVLKKLEAEQKKCNCNPPGEECEACGSQ